MKCESKNNQNKTGPENRPVAHYIDGVGRTSCYFLARGNELPVF